MLGAAAGFCAVQLATSEQFQVNGGLGHDGVVYAMMTRELPQQFEGKEMNRYRLQRVLPCAIVHVGLRACGRPLSNQEIVRGFRVLNSAAIVLTILVWGMLARRLGLSASAAWLGVVGLIVNVAVGKMAFFYANLTDTLTLFLGMLLLYGYVERSQAWMALAALLGSLTWPSFLYGAVPLMVFARRERNGDAALPGERTALRIAVVLLSVVVAGAVLFLHVGWDVSQVWRSGYRPPVRLSLSALVGGLFVLLSLGGLWTIDRERASVVRPLLRSFSPLGLGLSVALLLAREAYYLRFDSGAAARGPLSHLNAMLVAESWHVGAFLVGHVVYLGPLVLLLFLWWGRICREARRLGAGFSLHLAPFLVLALDSDSRHMLNVWPDFVLLVALVWDQAAPRGALTWLTALAVLFSKLWLPFNGPPLFGRPEEGQNYLMNVGAAMSAEAHAVQGLACVVALLIVALAMKKRAVTAPHAPVSAT